jgi:hypothetical protein
MKIPPGSIGVKGTARHPVSREDTKHTRSGRILRKDEEGRYANYFQIGHNAFEFLVEFGQQEGKIHTRIYLSPPHARILSDLLANTLAEHERIFGPTLPPVHNEPEK